MPRKFKWTWLIVPCLVVAALATLAAVWWDPRAAVVSLLAAGASAGVATAERSAMLRAAKADAAAKAAQAVAESIADLDATPTMAKEEAQHEVAAASPEEKAKLGTTLFQPNGKEKP